MSKPPEKMTKKLYYRRATFNGIKVKKSLQQKIEDAHSSFTTSKSRTFPGSFGTEVHCANSNKTKEDYTLLHIVSYVPDQAASVVDKPSTAKSSNTSEVIAPDGSDFLGGDVFILIKDNHVLLCASGRARESLATYYLRCIIEKSGKKKSAATLDLEKVANVDKTKMIKEEGVKSLELGVSLYEASMTHMEAQEDKNRVSRIMDIPAAVAGLIMEVFEKDQSLKEIQDAENVNMKLSLSFDGRQAIKNREDENFGVSGKARLNKSSELLLKELQSSEDLDGFKITTFGGNEISSDEIRVSRLYRIKRFGNSLDRDETWDILASYYKTLSSKGILEQ